MTTTILTIEHLTALEILVSHAEACASTGEDRSNCRLVREVQTSLNEKRLCCPISSSEPDYNTDAIAWIRWFRNIYGMVNLTMAYQALQKRRAGLLDLTKL